MEISKFLEINKDKVSARLGNALNNLDFHYKIDDVYKMNKLHFRTLRNVGDKTIDEFFKLRNETSENIGHLETTKKDSIVESVVNQFKERSKRGIEKYGTTLQENNTDDFLQHFKEELMDAILYIEKLQTQRNGN